MVPVVKLLFGLGKGLLVIVIATVPTLSLAGPLTASLDVMLMWNVIRSLAALLLAGLFVKHFPDPSPSLHLNTPNMAVLRLTNYGNYSSSNY
jgi:hypothetical protein